MQLLIGTVDHHATDALSTNDAKVDLDRHGDSRRSSHNAPMKLEVEHGRQSSKSPELRVDDACDDLSLLEASMQRDQWIIET